MSLLDQAKAAAQKAAAKGKELAAEHKDTVDKAIDKGGAALDKQTQGKFHDQLSKATDKATELVQKLPDKE